MTTTATNATLLSPTITERLYVIRAVIALIWAGLLGVAVSFRGPLTADQAIPAFAVALLISYPLIDVIASLIEARSSRRVAPRSAATQVINAAISAVATAAIAVAASHGVDAVLLVFGGWALLTGIIQLILAIVRGRHGAPGQLPMILSGSISCLAGIAFVLMAASKSELNLINLAAYATAGAIFFLASAWRLRSRRETAGTRTTSPARV